MRLVTREEAVYVALETVARHVLELRHLFAEMGVQWEAAEGLWHLRAAPAVHTAHHR